MADSIHRTDTIYGFGYPICFKARSGQQRPGVLSLDSAEDVFITQARAMGGHQKEPVVTEGLKGASWRMVSEGISTHKRT
jgi:hypothetical protein